METLEPLVTDTPVEEDEATVDEGTGRRRRSGGRRTRHVAGRRRAQRAERLRTLGRRVSLTLAGLAVLAGVVVIAAVLLERAPSVPGPPATTAPQPAAAPAPDLGTLPVADQGVVLLIRTQPGQDGAAGLTLLSSDSVGGQAALFIPATSLVEIPGVGLDRVGLAQQYGGIDLTVATVENALGVQIDGGVLVDDRGLGAILERAGGAAITVPQRLVDRNSDGTGSVAFDAGPQYVNGVRLADYWSFQQRGESDLDTFSRQQTALGALLTALADPVMHQRLLDPLPPEVSTTVEEDVLRGLLGTLATAQAAGEVSYQLLPVIPFGSADEQLGTSYQLHADQVDALVAATMPGAVPDGGGSQALPVQVLNGVGAPGVGQRVDDALAGLPLRIVLSDNAREFGVRQTQIVIYEETPDRLATAEQVRAALGVGTILVSRQPQSVVDLTIVVGADFTGGGPRVPNGL